MPNITETIASINNYHTQTYEDFHYKGAHVTLFGHKIEEEIITCGIYIDIENTNINDVAPFLRKFKDLVEEVALHADEEAQRKGINPCLEATVSKPSE